MSKGFQSLGAEELNTRAPTLLKRDVGTVSSPAEDAGGSVFMTEVTEVSGGSVVRRRVLVVDAVSNREPVQMDENGGDVVR